MSMIAVTAGISLLSGMAGMIQQGQQAKLEKARERQMAKRLKALEESRQKVIDQSDKIRGLKDQVFNPAANLGVAMQATNLQLEQTDQSLANTLDAINRGGAGAGAATQLARLAATSKAQVAAGLEKQELNNQQLRLEGEAKAQSQKMQLEQMAIGEEVSAWGRQEDRDLVQMDRIAGMQFNAAQRAAEFQQGATASMMAGVTGATTAMANFEGFNMGSGNTQVKTDTDDDG